MSIRLPPPRSRADLNSWKANIEDGLPNDREIVTVPPTTRFEAIDQRSVRFRWDPDPQAEQYEVQWSRDPDFTKVAPESRTVTPPANTITILLTDRTVEPSDEYYFFRTRSIRKGVKSAWSAPSRWGNPTPGALALFEALHTIDGPETENPIINVNINLPRTALNSGSSIEDLEALWTDHVELFGDTWSALAAELTAGATTMAVTAGTGIRFVVGAEYMLERGVAGQEEIVRVVSVATDVITIDRAVWSSNDVTHASSSEVKWYARIIREMFHSRGGVGGITVTVFNTGKVRSQQFTARALNRCDQASADSVATATLALPAALTDLAADPQFQKMVLTGSDLSGSAYRYEIYHATTGAVQINDADPTTTGNAALLSKPLAAHEGVAQFIHNVVYRNAVNHYYGVRAVDILGGLGTGGTVGPLRPDQFATQAAPDVTGISATEGPTRMQQGLNMRASVVVQSSVTCGFTPPSAGADPEALFDRCKIYVQPVGIQTALSATVNASATTFPVNSAEKLVGFRFYLVDAEIFEVFGFDFLNKTVTVLRGVEGSSGVTHYSAASITPHARPEFTRAEGSTSPLRFVTWPMGSATIYFVSVSKDGVENAILSSPNLTVTLDGIVSDPLEVQNLRGYKTIHGGKIFWDEGLEPDLDYYEIADLGSRTLVNQADIRDHHLIARVKAFPGGGNKVNYDWVETLYGGTISAGAKTIVLPADHLRENQFDPVGSPPVTETLRFVRLDADVANLTSNDYHITDTTASTVVLWTVPTEATVGGNVEFYIGTRAHKFYVRAVNLSGLTSEWRPIEGTFLELSATAPDGSMDIGVPLLYADLGLLVVFGTTFWTPGWLADLLGIAKKPSSGNAMVTVFARSLFEAETDFDLALKQNIGGITSIEIELQHSADGSTGLITDTHLFACRPERADFSHFIHPVVVAQGPPDGKFWKVSLGQFLIAIPNHGVPGGTVRVRVKNYFGWGDWALSHIHGSNPGEQIEFIGPGPIQPQTEETVVSNSVYPNLAGSKHRLIRNLLADATVKQPEYRGGTIAAGTSSRKARGGETFTIIMKQDAAASHDLAFDSNYKGLDGKGADARLNRYTAWTFLAESDTLFRCIGYVTGDI